MEGGEVLWGKRIRKGDFLTKWGEGIGGVRVGFPCAVRAQEA